MEAEESVLVDDFVEAQEQFFLLFGNEFVNEREDESPRKVSTGGGFDLADVREFEEEAAAVLEAGGLA